MRGDITMKLADRLFNSVEELWNSYLEHPFVKGIADGTLEIDKFRFYMIQDYRYLLEYAKVFAFGIIKSGREDVMRRFALMVKETLDGEMTIHKKYMLRLGISEREAMETKTSLINHSYTSYMLDIANKGDALDVLVAVLSCAWSYQFIGEHHMKVDGAIENETFGEWVEGYSCDDYRRNTQDIIDLVNELGEGITESRAKYLEEVFINCSRYEYRFWDMSYNKEM